MTQLQKVEEQGSGMINFALDGLAENTIVNYRGRLEEFLGWLDGRPLTNVSDKAYRKRLVEAGAGPSSINQALAAVKRLAGELENAGRLDHATNRAIQDVEGVHIDGRKVGRWLTQKETRLLLDAPDTATTRGVRDAVALSLLLGCALRRSEAAGLTWDHVQRRGETWALVDILGKGNKLRTVAVAEWMLDTLWQWRERVGDEGYVLRPVGRWGHVRDGGITPQAIHDIVREYGAAVGVPDLNPHDLRRTCARRLYEQAPDRLNEIRLILGHASIRTTERYLGLDAVDLDDPLTLEV